MRKTTPSRRGNQPRIVKCLQQLCKVNFKPKTSFKQSYTSHTMFLRRLGINHVKDFFDFVIVFYLMKYPSLNEPSFLLTDNSLLSLIFAEPKLMFSSLPECYQLVRYLHKSRFMLVDCTLIERTHTYYNEESLRSLLAVFLASKACKQMVFGIKNDMEYSFNVIFKGNETRDLMIVTVPITDQSNGNSAMNFYQEVLGIAERDLFVTEQKYQYHVIVPGLPPKYFLSIDSNLLQLGLAGLLQKSRNASYLEVVKDYVGTWYQPLNLCTQFAALAQNLKIG